ncbi:MAG: hypothetical protein QXG00_03300 [Candidatus Woesearchaeota archaeon]
MRIFIITKEKNRKIIILLMMLVFSLFFDIYTAFSLPSGDISVISNSTSFFAGYNQSNSSALGGTITTLIFNVSEQTMKWKAYVGNISGSLSLRSSNDFVLYDWPLTVSSGEIYASRSDAINWSSLICSDETIISNEEAVLGLDTTAVDSINRTFNTSVHKSFYVAGNNITNSSCRAISTNVNNSAQSFSEEALFQEVLLSDGFNLVYASILESKVVGYNNQTFDFQMIVADTETSETITSYYFYIELG